MIGAALLLWTGPHLVAVDWSAGVRRRSGLRDFRRLVGLFTIAVGVGPRTLLDVAYHVLILAVLGGGLALALRERARLG